MKTILCESCSDNGLRVPATWAAPSSPNGGKTVDFSPICDAHAAGWWDGADWDGRHLMQKLEQPQKRIWMLLSAEERLMVQELRACEMTGYSVHPAEHPGPDPMKPLLGREKFGFYVWPMGSQPSYEQVKALAASDPVQAARIFLKAYKAKHEIVPPDSRTTISYYARPEVR